MRRILVVDDDPPVGLAVVAWLKRFGFKAAIAAGGTGSSSRAIHSTLSAGTSVLSGKNKSKIVRQATGGFRLSDQVLLAAKCWRSALQKGIKLAAFPLPHTNAPELR